MKHSINLLTSKGLWLLFVLGFLLMAATSCKQETPQPTEVQASPVEKAQPKYPDQSDMLVGIWEMSKFDLYIDAKNKPQEYGPGQFDSLLGFHSQRIEYFHNKTFAAKYFDANGRMSAFQDGVWSVEQRELKIEVLKPAPEKWTSNYVIRNNQLFTKTYVDFDGDGEADDLMVTQADRQKPTQ
ncbi:MAG: hypothetical protein AAF598_03825 [Bacteroidota bacterium]